MRLDEITLKTEVVDGQELHILNREKFDIIVKDPIIDGVLIGGDSIMKLLIGTMEVVKSYPEFSLSFYRRNTPTGFSWLPIVLYKMSENMQRVHIERLTCESCGWYGNTANPTEPSLYFGVSNRHEALDIAWKIPVVTCPKCNTKLPRHPIWVEPID